MLHLAPCSRFQDDCVCPGATTRAGIADGLGIERVHVSVELKRLLGKGLVKFKRGHVRTTCISLNVYSLTPIGETFVRKVKEMDWALAITDSKADSGLKDAGAAGGESREEAAAQDSDGGRVCPSFSPLKSVPAMASVIDFPPYLII